MRSRLHSGIYSCASLEKAETLIAEGASDSWERRRLNLGRPWQANPEATRSRILLKSLKADAEVHGKVPMAGAGR